jgi:hypothetical protein
MKRFNKLTCSFFDQVNIYGKFRCAKDAAATPSTDLSTDIVDKIAIFGALGLGREVLMRVA